MVAIKRDFADLVARAEQIVVGTVISVRAGENAAGSPVTLVTLADLSVLKGSADNELTLEFYGGTQGDTATRIFDMPQFHEGDRSVLFVAGNGRDICPLVGLWQGQFRIRFDSERNTDVVDTNDGRTVVGHLKRELQFASTSDHTAAATSLDDFRQMISDELANPSPRDVSQ